MKKKSLAILLTLLLLLAMTACGGASYSGASGGTGSFYTTTETAAAPSAAANGYAGSDSAAYDEAEYWAEAPMDAPAERNEGAGFDLPEGVKMIYRANLELETQEFEKARSDIQTLTQTLGGYF